MNEKIKIGWDRNWGTYLIKAVFKDDMAGRLIHPLEDKLEGWESHIIQLPNSIIMDKSIKSILVVNRNDFKCRIYPPFSLNQKAKMTALFEDIMIPEGEEKVSQFFSLPENAVKGATSEVTIDKELIHTHAIRFDAQIGFPLLEVYQQLMQQIAQHTYQWWIRSTNSPFKGPIIMGAFIDKNYNTLKNPIYSQGGQIESPWHGMTQTQSPLGIERSLTEQVWLLCLHNIQNQIPAETGLLNFLDAISAYMANDDENCILRLSICFEILANKRLLMLTNKEAPSNKELLRKTDLVNGATLDIIKKLIIDRDHVAHGRPPYILQREPNILSQYLDAISKAINNYFKLIPVGKWPEFASMKLGKNKRI